MISFFILRRAYNERNIIYKYLIHIRLFVINFFFHIVNRMINVKKYKFKNSTLFAIILISTVTIVMINHEINHSHIHISLIYSNISFHGKMFCFGNIERTSEIRIPRKFYWNFLVINRFINVEESKKKSQMLPHYVVTYLCQIHANNVLFDASQALLF